jgi:hypothetical protein
VLSVGYEPKFCSPFRVVFSLWTGAKSFMSSYAIHSIIKPTLATLTDWRSFIRSSRNSVCFIHSMGAHSCNEAASWLSWHS